MCEPTTILAVSAMAMTAYSGWRQGKSVRAQSIATQNYYNYVAQQKEIEAKEALNRQSFLQHGMCCRFRLL